MGDPTGTNLTDLDARRWQGADPNARTFRLGERLQALRSDVDARDGGGTAWNAILLSTNPTATDTLTIGSDTYEFQAAAASLADDDNVAVLIGANATATFANLVAAINGTAAAEHASIFRTDGTTPARGVGSESVVATADTPVTNWLIVQPAIGPGGTTAPGAASLAFDDDLTAAVAWYFDDFSACPSSKAPAQGRASGVQELTVTAGMISAGAAIFTFSFDVGHYVVDIRTSSDARRGPGTDTVTSNGTSVLIQFGKGSAPDIQAGDVVTVAAWE